MPYVCDTNQWAKLPTEQNKWRYNHSIIAKVHNSCLLQKWLGPLKQHCSHSYIILSTILLVKSRSAETSIYFAQKHQLSYASVLVTYLPVDMLVTSIQSYTPDKHQLAQVSLCNISQMLNCTQLVSKLAGHLSPWNASWGRLTGNSNASSGCNLFVQLVFISIGTPWRFTPPE